LAGCAPPKSGDIAEAETAQRVVELALDRFGRIGGLPAGLLEEVTGLDPAW
jgi:hypothetical protein